MAIVFEQAKKPINWVGLLFIVFIVGFLIFAVYYLFFAPSPKLDIVLPPPLERASQIISITEFVNPDAVVNSTAFKRLRTYVGQPAIGVLGRENPFVRL